MSATRSKEKTSLKLERKALAEVIAKTKLPKKYRSDDVILVGDVLTDKLINTIAKGILST